MHRRHRAALAAAAVVTLAALVGCSSGPPLVRAGGTTAPPTAPASADPSVLAPAPTAPAPATAGTTAPAPGSAAAATSTAAAGAPASSPAPAPPSPVPSGPPGAVAPSAGYAAPALAWKPCEGTFECASLVVPVDYAAPGGPTLPVALIRRPAGDRVRRLGSLVVNPGGPGGSGVDFVRDNSEVFSPTLRARFDVVGFDPRGVGRSRGVDCTTDTQLDTFFHDDPVPVSAAARSTYTRDSKSFAHRCGTSAGTLLGHVGTVEAARDLDVLRTALGEVKLTYFGYSYGTYLGATYAQLFPTHLRAAVLDGVVDPSLDLVGFVQGQAKAFEAALDRWFAWCTPAQSCSFAGRDGRTSQQRFDALAAGLRAHPLAVRSRSLGPGEFSYGVGYAMYSRSLWPDLAVALTAAEGGDGAGLLALSDSYTSRSPSGHYDDATDANYAVNCLDHVGPRTEQGWYDAAAAVRAAAPRLGEAIVYNTLPCAYWPVPARPTFPVRAAGAPPILLVGTTHDPATPYAWAQSTAKQLASSVLLTHEGDGHTAYGPGVGCVVQAADRYLVDLVPPAAGTRC